MTPLYDKDNLVKWRDLEFEDLLKLVQGRLNFHAHRHENKIPGFDQDDIRQELIFTLWSKLDKIPIEIQDFDFRFLKYIDTIFFREITNIWRKHTFQEGEDRVYRDELSRSLPMVDNFDEIWDE